MPRYAVLHDVTTEDTRPVGFAVERHGHVLVHAPRAFGIPEIHDGEYKVRQPDMNYVTYRPGDPGYFDQVLIDLSWAFAVGEQDDLESVTDKTILDLMVSKVDRVRHRSTVGEYKIVFFPETGQRDVKIGFDAPPYRHEPEEVEHLAVAAKGVVSV